MPLLTATNVSSPTSVAIYTVTFNVSRCFVDDALVTKVCLVMAYCTLILGSLVGNSLIIAVVRQDRHTKRTVSYFIQNMAAADLMITLVYMPRMIAMIVRGYEWLVDGLLGLVLCKVIVGCHHIAIFAAIQTLVVISVERFMAVVYPLKRNISKFLAKRLIVLIWLVSIAIRVPRINALTTKRNKHGTLVCSHNFDTAFRKDIYYNILFFAFYLTPLLIIAASYSAIMVTLKRRPLLGGLLSREERRREILNRKVFRMLFAVTVLFVLCWLMYFAIQILPLSFPCAVHFWRRFAAHANSAITPLTYIVFNENYRKGARGLVTRMLSYTANSRYADRPGGSELPHSVVSLNVHIQTEIPLT